MEDLLSTVVFFNLGITVSEREETTGQYCHTKTANRLQDGFKTILKCVFIYLTSVYPAQGHREHPRGGIGLLGDRDDHPLASLGKRL